MRLSIEITPEQLQRLKAVAALCGKSIKAYVLERVLPDTVDDSDALRQLETFLEPRFKAAQDVAVNKSVEQIFEETHHEEGVAPLEKR